jgi:hypothetical protein
MENFSTPRDNEFKKIIKQHKLKFRDIEKHHLGA